MSVRPMWLWSIGGGKGGVGKSSLTAYLGVLLARMGRSVVAVDADFGSSNLHTYLGIKSPAWTMLDILEKRIGLEDGLQRTPQEGLRLLSCAGDMLGTADPSAERMESFMRFLAELAAEFVLVDLGAGTSAKVLDLFNMAQTGIAVTSPDPAAMQSCYAFIKSAVYRRIQRHLPSCPAVQAALSLCNDTDSSRRPRTMIEFYELICTTDPEAAEATAGVVEGFRPMIVINMAATAQEQRAAQIIGSACRKFLNVNIRFSGLITCEAAFRRAAQSLELPAFGESVSPGCEQLGAVVRRLLAGSPHDDPGQANEARLHCPAGPAMGINDSIDFLGRQFHIQTEDLGFSGRSITTQVFCDGRVMLSKRSEYPEPPQEQAVAPTVAEWMRKQHMDVIRDLECRKAQILKAS